MRKQTHIKLQTTLSWRNRQKDDSNLVTNNNRYNWNSWSVARYVIRISENVPLDSDLAFVHMTRTSLVVTLVERAWGGLGDVNVLETSKDAQSRRTVIVSEHRPQTMPAGTFPKLEYDAEVRLIPARLLRAPSVERFVTHRNRSTSVYGQVHVSLAATLWEYPV